jgi:iron complex outermembrane recepter protein
MKTRLFLRSGLACAALLSLPSVAQAQDADNAVESAEDAFGTATRREQIGVYDEGNVRGFSPGTASNYRLEGMYFDIQGGMGGRVLNGSLIRVGPAAQGYAFPAPTGIVDLEIKKAEDKSSLSTFFSLDSYGAHGLEVDAQLPIAGKELAVSAGFGLFNNMYPNGGGSTGYNVGIVPRWRPAPNVELIAFANRQEFTDDTAGPIYIPNGNFAPPRFDLTTYSGPGWTKNSTVSNSFGLLGSARLGDWTIRTGLFRTHYEDDSGYANLVFINPDRSTERQVFARPGSNAGSWSGEFRVSRRFSEGPRQHLLMATIRGRSIDSQYGGGDVQSIGTAPLGSTISALKPVFAFGDLTNDEVRQTTGGLSYSLKWKGLGEVTAGAQRSHYVKRVDIPGVGLVSGTTDVTLPYFSASVTPVKNLIFYGSYVRGLEDAGTAPSFASNANQVLPAIRTEQFDFGLRWAPFKDTSIIVGYFSITKPYIDLDNTGRFGVLGDQHHRGIEFSVASNVTKNVRIVAGGVWLDPKVEASPSIATPVGLRPTGQPRLRTRFNINWTLPFAKDVTLDAYWNREGGSFGTVDNAVFAPGADRIGAGVRYRFKLAGKQFTARVAIYNIFDTQFFLPFGNGAYGHNIPRNVQGWISADF